MGIPPPTAKLMEVWEAASVLGVGYVNPDGPQQQLWTPGQQEPAPKGVSQESLDLIRQRVAAAEGRGPAPQVSATNPETIAAMMNAFSNRQ